MADDRNVVKNQKQFQQRSEEGERELQEFLAKLLDLPGLVRCYTTEVTNPTAQLKNKLSQAAPAARGLLCLSVADEAARDTAAEALTERWMSNPNWPKAVSAVALATKINGRPRITTVVECRPTDHGQKIRERLFPDVDVRRVEAAEPDGSHVGPLNLVLYGPPGTGKTHSVVERAVRVCDGSAPADRAELMRRFGELRKEQRIELVTFHQSYGYEDFVEGIRPIVLGENASDTGDVRFEVVPGVFKRLCEMAKTAHKARGAAADVDIEQATIWKMSLGNTQNDESSKIYPRCIEKGWLLLGYGHGLDYSDCEDQRAVLAKVQTVEPKATGTDIHVSTVHALKNTMQVGDLVIVSDGNRFFRAIGKVVGEYRFMPDEDYAQMRPVQWLAEFEESLPRERISTKDFSQRTLYQPDRTALKLGAIRDLLSDEGDAAPATPRNHVLIIDEINRGNVSKILGELITLLEEDKRIGALNELLVTLPHSKQQFGVPGNVYVIGTMNTADRSIAFLDTALRRRFDFEECLPDLAVVRRLVGEVGGIDVADLLGRLNERIELLYDRDHQIGHAYFMDVRTLADLRRVFCSKVIPLLQEYFYGDWAKLCHVLGCPFDPDTGKAVTKNGHPMVSSQLLTPEKLVSAAAETIDPRVRCGVNPAFLGAADEDLASFFRAAVRRAEKTEEQDDSPA